MNFMSITLDERHSGTGLGGDTDLSQANSFTTADSPAEVVIDGGGRLLRTYGTDNPTIAVGAGVTLTLRNIILEKRTSESVVKVEGGGHLILEDGVVIRGGVNSGSSSGGGGTGGGVLVEANGTLTMRGGTISGNRADYSFGGQTAYGGGVYVAGMFIMEGGAVSGNAANGSSAAYGGGVYVAAGGAFEMKGGTVSGNTLIGGTTRGGGVYVAGPDGGVPGGAFEKTGGTIYGGAEGDTLGGTVLKNTSNQAGDGVYVADGGRQRNTNAGPEVYLNSAEGFNWEGIPAISGSGTTRDLEAGKAHWSTFTAPSSGPYLLQWQDSTENGGVSYGANIQVSAYRSNRAMLFGPVDKGYTVPQFLSLAAGETIYVRVVSQTYIPTVGTDYPGIDPEPIGNYALRCAVLPTLAASWGADKTLDHAGRIDLYSFTAAAAGTYLLQWRDSDEPGGYGANIQVSAFNTGLTAVMGDTDKGYITPRLITLSAGQTVYVKVTGKNGTAGTYGIRYAQNLGEDLAHELTDKDQVDWYSFTAGTSGTYYLQWEDTNGQAASVYTGNIKVSAHLGLMPLLGDGVTGGGYTSPKSLGFLSAGQTVTVKVETRTGQDTEKGSYTIRCYW